LLFNNKMKQMTYFLSLILLISSVFLLKLEKLPVYESPVIVKSSQLGNRGATVSLSREKLVYITIIIYSKN